jgi:hypothetical protein
VAEDDELCGQEAAPHPGEAAGGLATVVDHGDPQARDLHNATVVPLHALTSADEYVGRFRSSFTTFDDFCTPAGYGRCGIASLSSLELRWLRQSRCQ